MSDCDNCTKCAFPDSAWFPPSAIVFCRPQVLFYLYSAGDFRSGCWTPNPDGSSYTDPSIRSDAVHIPALNAEQLSAEIDVRLKKCGIEGKLLELEVQDGLAIEDFQRCRNCGKKYCPSLKALGYISGWDRRKESYKDFKSRTRTRL